MDDSMDDLEGSPSPVFGLFHDLAEPFAGTRWREEK